MTMTGSCSRRCLLKAMGLTALAGCAGDMPGDSYGYQGPFYEEDWIYYYEEDDEYFFEGLTDEQKDALRQKWASLTPDEKQEILDRWGDLDDSQRASLREAWSGLDAGQRQAVLSSMQARARTGTLRAVTPPPTAPSRVGTTSSPGLGGSRPGSLDRGGLGTRGGGGLGGYGGGLERKRWLLEHEGALRA